jgi:hypothetical protein
MLAFSEATCPGGDLCVQSHDLAYAVSMRLGENNQHRGISNQWAGHRISLSDLI